MMHNQNFPQCFLFQGYFRCKYVSHDWKLPREVNPLCGENFILRSVARRGGEKWIHVTNTAGTEGIAIILSLKFHLATGESFHICTAYDCVQVKLLFISFLCSMRCADWLILYPDHLLRAWLVRRLRSQDSLSQATWLNGKEKLKIRRIF